MSGFFVGMAQERPENLLIPDEAGSIDLSGIVSPFEIQDHEEPITAPRIEEPLQEKFERSISFARQQTHALKVHYPLRHRRASQIIEDPVKTQTYRKILTTAQAKSLEETDQTSPDPDFSNLEYKPPESDEQHAYVFMSVRDLEEIGKIIKSPNAVLVEEDFDPEIIEVLTEDMNRGIVGGNEPTQYDDMITSDIRKKTYPIEDSFEHDSRP